MGEDSGGSGRIVAFKVKSLARLIGANSVVVFARDKGRYRDIDLTQCRRLSSFPLRRLDILDLNIPMREPWKRAQSHARLYVAFQGSHPQVKVAGLIDRYILNLVTDLYPSLLHHTQHRS